MHEVDFYKLSRPVQDRFIESTRGTGVPAPLLRKPPSDRRAALWLVGTAAGLLVVVLLATLGFGELHSPLALQSRVLMGAYAAAFAVMFGCGLRALALWRDNRIPPYRTGVYLFPVGVVDARQPKMRVYPVSELTNVEAIQPSYDLRLVFADGQSFAFPVGKQEQIEQAQNVIERSKQALEHAQSTYNRRELALLDPLKDTGFSNPFSPTSSIPRPVPLLTRFALPVALVLGAGLGWSAWTLRNRASEQELYEAARAADDIASYRAYLARGGKRPVVSEVLLPRAELRAAREKKTVAAIERFLEKRPNTKIQDEADAALRQALIDALAAARDKGTLTALHEFQQKYERYQLIDAELQQAKQAVYNRVYDRFRKQAPEDSEEVVAFVQRLLNYARKHATKAVVRFQRVEPDSMQRAEKMVRKSTYYQGKKSLPSQYFDAEHARRREEHAAERLIQRFQQAFPNDILELSLGEAVPPDAEAFPEIEVPTLFIEHRAEMSGGYLSRQPRGIFVGVGFIFRTSFRIPDGEQPLETKHTAWHRPDLKLLRDNEDATVEDLYEKMAREGYEQFTREYVGTFFSAEEKK